MSKRRKTTGIMVDVLEPIKQDGIRSREKFGLIQKKNKTYILCEEGVGPIDALEDGGEYSLLVYEDNDSYLPDIAGEVTLNKSNIGNLSVTHQEDLADFIRKFGSRLEANYRSWVKVLS